jgi:hypothetical protein
MSRPTTSGPLAQAVLETQIAVRAHAPRTRTHHPRKHLDKPELVLVLDTETRVDHAQALLCGSYQVREATGKLRQEGLFYGDLSPDEMAILLQYVADHDSRTGGHLRLHSRRTFLREVFWPLAYKARARVVCFNAPWDLSRLAYGWRRARNGGFTLLMFESVDAGGRVWPDRYRPAIRIKALDSKRNFIAFAAPAHLDDDLREDGHVYAGRFVDLRTLAYALTDHSLSLDGAAAEFGLEVRKATAPVHGVLTPEYIDYNRQDTEVTWQLHEALVAEWDRHPIDLAPEQGYSPAAVSKAYLGAIGVRPPAERSDLTLDHLGQAMTAYYGGRTETRIRGVPLPVRYVDFASMYPTVFALQGLWDWVTAERLTTEDATDDARALLASLDRAALHDPTVWRRLAGVFCRVRPAGDLLPVRARYGADAPRPAGDVGSAPTGSLAWTIGLNRLEADTDLWFTLADLLVAKLLGESTPTILEAFRVTAEGRSTNLRPIRLRGSLDVDPTRDDLFRLATEERARLKTGELPTVERDRLGQFLKTLANGGAYGIFAEVRQLDPVPGGREVDVHGLWPLTARVPTPEEPGAFSFPPLAATVTGAARLLLGLLQADIEARGGTYVACDTDSLSIVSSETGGLVPCPGGADRFDHGTPAVLALSWLEVAEVLEALEPLNPYSPGTVPSLIKLEPENFALDEPTRPTELYALATSSKRYALYNRSAEGVVLRKASEHGLGLYRSPLPGRGEGEPTWTAKWPEWVDVVWRRFIAAAEGLPLAEPPTWFDLPAVSQLPVSSPAVLAPFRALNDGLAFEQQVKPFGFLLLGHLDPLAALPDGLDRSITPMAPFTSDPEELLSLPWRNRRDGKPIEVTTRRDGERGKARLQTIGDVVVAYRLHPETKSGDPRGGLGRRGSVGVLPRLTVRAAGVPVHIGKESNRLDEVEDGVITDPDDVYVEYRDERREWEAALPALRRLREEKGWRHLAEAAGLSERSLRYALNGGKLPHRRARARLQALVDVSRASSERRGRVDSGPKRQADSSSESDDRRGGARG